jgi:hypothetical protein
MPGGQTTDLDQLAPLRGLLIMLFGLLVLTAADDAAAALVSAARGGPAQCVADCVSPSGIRWE